MSQTFTPQQAHKNVSKTKFSLKAYIHTSRQMDQLY